MSKLGYTTLSAIKINKWVGSLAEPADPYQTNRIRIREKKDISLIYQVLEGFKSNEDQLKKYVDEYKGKLKKSVIFNY